MVNLPQELIETIVDDLHARHGKYSLSACALASRAFLVPSQRCLFRSISLKKMPRARTQRVGRSDSVLVGAVNIFTASPRLAPYVRNLSINITNLVAIHASLTSLLPLLPNVDEFQLDAARIAWTSLPPTLTSSLSDFFRQPSLRCLALVSLRDLSSSLVLRWISSFRMLSLTNVTILRDTGAPSITYDDKPAATAHLDHLILGWPNGPTVTQFVLHPSTIVHLQQLRRLSLHMHSDGTVRGFEKLLLHCAQSLRELELNLRGKTTKSLSNCPISPRFELSLSLAKFRKRIFPIASSPPSRTSPTGCPISRHSPSHFTPPPATTEIFPLVLGPLRMTR
ncbi:hypothetical protein C8J57DRAFT_413313 [Mycena rebaudengoi]|nr:hypothetical protein C8J57DRAFT_413313 [Mycena rebaudengoi]